MWFVVIYLFIGLLFYTYPFLIYFYFKAIQVFCSYVHVYVTLAFSGLHARQIYVDIPAYVVQDSSQILVV